MQCAICRCPVDAKRKPEAKGLLCANCNRGIGLLQDDPDILRAAADYLDDWKKRHDSAH